MKCTYLFLIYVMCFSFKCNIISPLPFLWICVYIYYLYTSHIQYKERIDQIFSENLLDLQKLTTVSCVYFIYFHSYNDITHTKFDYTIVFNNIMEN